MANLRSADFSTVDNSHHIEPETSGTDSGVFIYPNSRHPAQEVHLPSGQPGLRGRGGTGPPGFDFDKYNQPAARQDQIDFTSGPSESSGEAFVAAHFQEQTGDFLAPLAELMP